MRSFAEAARPSWPSWPTWSTRPWVTGLAWSAARVRYPRHPLGRRPEPWSMPLRRNQPSPSTLHVPSVPRRDSTVTCDDLCNSAAHINKVLSLGEQQRIQFCRCCHLRVVCGPYSQHQWLLGGSGWCVISSRAQQPERDRNAGTFEPRNLVLGFKDGLMLEGCRMVLELKLVDKWRFPCSVNGLRLPCVALCFFMWLMWLFSSTARRIIVANGVLNNVFIKMDQNGMYGSKNGTMGYSICSRMTQIIFGYTMLYPILTHIPIACIRCFPMPACVRIFSDLDRFFVCNINSM